MGEFPGMPLAVGVILLLVGVFGIGLPQLSRSARLRRRLRREPLRALKDVRSDEVVRVRGTVSPPRQPVHIPFGERPGVFHVTRVTDSSNPGQTITFAREGRQEIVFDDGTGCARIAVETPIELLGEEETGGISRDDPELATVLGRDVERIFGKGATVLWSQRSVAVGDEITVWGRACREPDPAGPRDDASYRDEPTRVALVPAEPGSKIVVELARRRS
jgi:hypothetical protein